MLFAPNMYYIYIDCCLNFYCFFKGEFLFFQISSFVSIRFFLFFLFLCLLLILFSFPFFLCLFLFCLFFFAFSFFFPISLSFFLLLFSYFFLFFLYYLLKFRLLSLFSLSIQHCLSIPIIKCNLK